MVPKTKNFSWGLKPLIQIAKMFGYQLEVCNSKLAQDAKCTIVVFGFFVFIITCIVNVLEEYNLIVQIIPFVVDLARTYKEFNLELGDDVTRLLLVDLFQVLFFSSMVSIVQFTFLFHRFVSGKWKDLWLNLLKIQHEIKLTESFYKKCRNRCYLALFLLFLVNLKIFAFYVLFTFQIY